MVDLHIKSEKHHGVLILSNTLKRYRRRNETIRRCSLSHITRICSTGVHASIEHPGILTPQGTPDKHFNATQERPHSTLSDRSSNELCATPPKRASLSSDENGYPCIPSAPRRLNDSVRFKQQAPPPKFGIACDGAADLESSTPAEPRTHSQRRKTSHSDRSSRISVKVVDLAKTHRSEEPNLVAVADDAESVGACSSLSVGAAVRSILTHPKPTCTATPTSLISVGELAMVERQSPQETKLQSIPVTPRRTHTNSARPHDRFVSAWSPTTRRRNHFLISHDVDRLTPIERLSRCISFSPDPFVPPSRTRPPEQHRAVIPLTPEAPHYRTGTTILPGLQNSSTPTSAASSSATTGFGMLGATEDGYGGYIGRGTNAPLYSAEFLVSKTAKRDANLHERRLAIALGVNQAGRMLDMRSSPSTPLSASASLLDAPSLRDDYYATLLTYNRDLDVLAVGLGTNVHLWSETGGVNSPDALNRPTYAHVTSLSFTSSANSEAVLATGRADGTVSLWHPLEDEPRFEFRNDCPVSCLSFSPVSRKGDSDRDKQVVVEKNDLLIGDEEGNVHFWNVEWPSTLKRDLFNFPGSLTLVARLSIHTQQICGLAWSPNGSCLVSGGNDNLCAFYLTQQILSHPQPLSGPFQFTQPAREIAQPIDVTFPQYGSVPAIAVPNQQWTLSAAVKALAFSPHHRSLLALGGGSNDRHIHFVHTASGAVLARIDCSARVTALVWSQERREIAATFGFAQPEHRIRVAVFAWPSCEQLVAISWADEHRALWAVAYPAIRRREEADEIVGRDGFRLGLSGGSGGRGSIVRRISRQRQGVARANSGVGLDGCLVVSTSDASIKFHEIWPEPVRSSGIGSGRGELGGSPILEDVFTKAEVLR